eukprot:1247895-Rhodomonas_salina.1
MSWEEPDSMAGENSEVRGCDAGGGEQNLEDWRGQSGTQVSLHGLSVGVDVMVDMALLFLLGEEGRR